MVVDGETGLLVPPRDHRRWRTRSSRLLKDPALRARMGAAGLARVRAQIQRRTDGGADTLRVYERVALARAHSGGEAELTAYCGTPTNAALQPDVRPRAVVEGHRAAVL